MQGITWAMNLGKFDFFPAESGKGNVVAYLQSKASHQGLEPWSTACLSARRRRLVAASLTVD